MCLCVVVPKKRTVVEAQQNQKGSAGRHYSSLCVKGGFMEYQQSGSTDNDDNLQF